MSAPTPDSLLDDDLLERLRARAAEYDRRNAFFTEDLADLGERGYLRALVPVDFGGLGWNLDEVVRAQMRLAGAAPATALGVNMHLVWTGVARVLHDRGDDSLDFVLREAADGEVFAFGISEAGNDLMLFGSGTVADPQRDGSVRYTGRKIFTSLSPAWTRLGVHGLDTRSDDAPKLVYGFIDREDPDVRVLDDWDTIGMRATQSRTTVLDGAVAAPDRVVRRLDPGPNPDPFVFAIFACFELFLSSVYAGLAARALDLAIESARARVSKKTGKPRSEDPDARRRIASAALALDAVPPQLLSLARDVRDGVDHGPFWFAKLSGVKVRTVQTAREVVERAVQVSGGGTYFAGDELGRLQRDVLAGVFHPSSEDAALTTIANAWLGPVTD
ncbi:alkylation response protein AidB-like acyl-CoA dehydrogenase [Agromyces flavus]|uniref:Acyl-CoA dehydrogenase n=1 Tax=Agromyces flavus TaxID=589382 RepID=A0A1H1MIS2_9MICO|nr:acyl-CoA dehydrogenase family protein [Agromyces flavus]MCP2368793.1 alkylation response protein AidB-like acyl-CoA dehydrogenase [Agromyces flavus]GGI47969.1 acyl-CoA dehydrogenase [Agromyces flavus]SDR86731.1 Acyl-CoA dehydrogenase [Agromyces flavus]